MAGVDLAEALATHDGLGEFEGDDVLRVAIEIPNAAGGLREAMKFAPIVLHRGDEVFIGLRCNVKKLRFDPIPDVEGAVARIQILDAEEAVFIDGDTLAEALQKQRDLIEAARVEVERAKGIERLPMGADGGASDGDEDEEAFVLARNHAAGTHHDVPMAGCPVCLQEGRVDAEGNVLTGATVPEENGAEPTPITKGRGRKQEPGE